MNEIIVSGDFATKRLSKSRFSKACSSVNPYTRGRRSTMLGQSGETEIVQCDLAASGCAVGMLENQVFVVGNASESPPNICPSTLTALPFKDPTWISAKKAGLLSSLFHFSHASALDA